MARIATLSTAIDAQVKEALTAFCKRRGLKIQHIVEQAILEQLEDEIDLEAYHQRRNEEHIPLEKVLAGSRSTRSKG
jgi:antitoxin component of RelBE/YafQ-DinJ toxin-antitoxin module